MFGKKKYKKKATNKLISEILKNTNKSISNRLEKEMKINNFFKNYEHENFEDVLAFFFKDPTFLQSLPQNNRTNEMLLNQYFFDMTNISIEKSLIVLKHTILSNKEEIYDFERAKVRIESYIFINETNKIKEELDYLERKYGVTVWSINLRIACLYLDNSDKDYYEIYQLYEKVNENQILLDTIQCQIAKFTVTDTTSFIRNNENRKVKELIDGKAYKLAAYFSLISGVYPLETDIDLLYCSSMLHHFPTYDIFNYLYISFSQFLISNKICKGDEEIFSKVISFVRDINIEIPNTRYDELTRLITRTQEEETGDLQGNTDYENYCKGNYQEIINNLESNYLNSENIITKVNIYAKSYIRAGKKPKKHLPKFLYETIIDFIKIYKLENSTQAINNITSYIYKFNNFEISFHLLSALAKAAPYLLDKKNLIILTEQANLSFLNVTPLVKNLSERLSIASSYKGLDKSEYLVLKEDLCSTLLSNPIDDSKAQNLLNKIAANNPIKKDYIELLIEYYIKSKKIPELIDLAATELIKNHESVICFPLKRISKFIEDIDCISIDSVIIAHFLNSENKMKNEDFLRDCFEDYIIHNNDKRPSEILESIQELTPKEIYFYQHMCLPRLLTYQGCYIGGSSEVNNERVKILTLLYSKFKVNTKEIEAQIKDSLNEIIVTEGLTRISTARIKLNISELVNCKINDIRSLINLYREDEEVLIEKDRFSESEYLKDTGGTGIIATGSKNKIVNKIINTLRIEFLDNPDFGLDKLLSSTIRHSFFNDEISIKPTNKKLISEFDKNGKFEEKTYWLNKYNFVDEKLLVEIMNKLDDFNQSYNQLITQAESWMKVSWTEENPHCIFSFPFEIDLSDYDKIHKEIKEGSDANKIAYLIFKILVEQLEIKLVTMRAKLNDKFSYEMDKILQELLDNIYSVKRGAALTDLISDINFVKNGIKEDIKTTCEWFYINKNKELKDSIELSKIIQISERFLQKSSTKKNTIETVFHYDYLVKSTHTPTLNLCLINLFTNAHKYSKPNSVISLIVDRYGESGFTLKIKNELTDKRIRFLENGELEKITKNLLCKKSIMLLKTEGGTGLYKSAYDLNLASSKYKLTPSLNGSMFTVEINYDETHSNC